VSRLDRNVKLHYKRLISSWN